MVAALLAGAFAQFILGRGCGGLIVDFFGTCFAFAWRDWGFRGHLLAQRETEEKEGACFYYLVNFQQKLEIKLSVRFLGYLFQESDSTEICRAVQLAVLQQLFDGAEFDCCRLPPGRYRWEGLVWNGQILPTCLLESARKILCVRSSLAMEVLKVSQSGILGSAFVSNVVMNGASSCFMSTTIREWGAELKYPITRLVVGGQVSHAQCGQVGLHRKWTDKVHTQRFRPVDQIGHSKEACQ